MAFDDLFTDCQPDAGARILRPRVQPLEESEDPLYVLRLYADPIVPYAKYPALILAAGRDLHPRRHTWAAELQPIGDQVLKDLTQLRCVGLHDGKLVANDLSVCIADGNGEVFDNPVDNGIRIHQVQLKRTGTGTRVAQKVVDQLLHSPRAV